MFGSNNRLYNDDPQICDLEKEGGGGKGEGGGGEDEKMLKKKRRSVSLKKFDTVKKKEGKKEKKKEEKKEEKREGEGEEEEEEEREEEKEKEKMATVKIFVNDEVLVGGEEGEVHYQGDITHWKPHLIMVFLLLPFSFFFSLSYFLSLGMRRSKNLMFKLWYISLCRFFFSTSLPFLFSSSLPSYFLNFLSISPFLSSILTLFSLF